MQTDEYEDVKEESMRIMNRAKRNQRQQERRLLTAEQAKQDQFKPPNDDGVDGRL